MMLALTILAVSLALNIGLAVFLTLRPAPTGGANVVSFGDYEQARKPFVQRCAGRGVRA